MISPEKANEMGLSAARGIINGLLIVTIFWGVVFLVGWQFL